MEVKARGALLAAGAVLIALAVPAGASARDGAHRRHIEIQEPTVAANLLFGSHSGYQVGVIFEEPDMAKLIVNRFTKPRFGVETTTYGAHFNG
jgi:hypothetical protein